MATKKKKSVSLSVKKGEKLPASKGAGLTAKGRAKYNKATGSKLKAPQPGGGKRKKSYSADEADQTPAEKRAAMTWAQRLRRVFTKSRRP